MEKIKRVLTRVVSYLALFLCLASSILFYARVYRPGFLQDIFSALFYGVLCLALIPLSFGLIIFLREFFFFLVALALRSQPIAFKFPHFTVYTRTEQELTFSFHVNEHAIPLFKSYFLPPSVFSSEKASKNYWRHLMAVRVWAPLALVVFCVPIAITCLNTSLWLYFLQLLIILSLGDLLRGLLSLSTKETINTSLLTIEARLSQNISYAALPYALFFTKEDLVNRKKYSRALYSHMGYHSAKKLFASQDFIRFIDFTEAFLGTAPDLSTKKMTELKADLLYAELVSLNRIGKIQLLYTPSLQKALQKPGHNLVLLRTRYTLMLLKDNNWQEANRVKAAWMRHSRRLQKLIFIQEEANLIRLALYQATTHHH